jgi:transcriptional regulator with XRE-family HTH domain
MLLIVFVVFLLFLRKFCKPKPNIMEKIKLLEARKTKGLTQLQIADKLCMSDASYSRREKGEIKIHITEWNKLAKILEVPIEEIYEADDTQMFIYNDHAVGNYSGTNNICPIPEWLLESQRKYVKKLEEEIAELKRLGQH